MFDQEYLLYALAQAKKSNPDTNVVLLGDFSNSYYKFIEFYNINKYFDEAREFKNVYKHHSNNDYSYELFCFQRWFILKEFMKVNHLKKCFCMDSDVMLYTDITKDQNKFVKFDFTLSYGISPHCIYINSLKALEKLCKFSLNIYIDDLLFKIKTRELTYQDWLAQKSPSLCDMTIFAELNKRQEITIGEISKIIDDTKYDHNINMAEGFEMVDGRKNIYFVNDEPFCQNLTLGKTIQFKALHFQGYQTKKYMKDYFLGAIIFKEVRSWAANTCIPRYTAEKSLLETTTYSNSIKSSSNLNETYVNLPFTLRRNINLIVFPDWEQSAEFLYSDLEGVVKAITTHPDRSQITLLIDTSNISDEEAHLVLSDIILSLLMESDLDTASTEIFLIGKLSEIQWKVLLTFIHIHGVLPRESQQAKLCVQSDNIIYCELDSFSQIHFFY